MTNLNKIAGFDVSKLSFDVCIKDGNSDKSIKCSYDVAGFKQLQNNLPQHYHCIMEATGPYYLRLAMWLYDRGFKVSVVNPLVIKRFSQMSLLRAKTDKADAKMIAAYGCTQPLQLWEPPKDYIIRLQQLNALYEHLNKHHTALLNQREAFMSSGLMNKQDKSFIDKMIVQVEKKQQLIETKMLELINSYHGEMMKNITSIPCIGKKSALLLIVLSDGFKRFKNHKQLSAYIGLAPRIYQSGTSVKSKVKICKMGMSRIRAALYLCAWSAKRCNKRCKELYDRLITRGKNKRLALIAVANKLIKQVFAIATSNSKYSINY
jgi:transposase